MVPGDQLARAAAWFADRTAVVDAHGQFTFRHFNERVNRLANGLMELGLRKGDRVAVLMHNRHECLEAYMALLKAGIIRVALNARDTASDHEHKLRDSGAAGLLITPEYGPTLGPLLGSLPDLRQVVSTGALEGVSGVHAYEQVLAGADTAEPGIAIAADDVVRLGYSGGTTGLPKGVVRTLRADRAMMTNLLLDAVAPTAEDVFLHVGPLSHASGTFALPYLLRGAANLIVHGFDPADLFRTVERERATATFLVPTMIHALLAHPDLHRRDLSSLQTIVYGGAPLAPERLHQAIAALGPVFVQVYGQAEASMTISLLRKEEHAAAVRAGDSQRLASAGRPFTDVEVRIVDDDGRSVGTREVGEVVVRSEHVMAGYWRNPEATAEALRDGWLHTRDLGRLDADGYLTLVDRKGDMIVSGGLNVYPTEIEEVLYRHPLVLEAVVIGVPDERWGEAIRAVVVPRAGAAIDPQELIDFCGQRLAAYKKPKSVDVVDVLPKSAVGKVLRRSVRERYWQGLERRVH